MEVAWLGSHGFVSSYADYMRLPLGVLEDCRMIAGAEQQAQERANRRPLTRRGGAS
jgi:hypothetical protein